MNPPFNIDSKTKEYIKANYGGRPLLPEVWFQKAIELFGTSVPIAMFTPYGFRLNQTDKSSRWKKFIEGEYPELTSIEIGRASCRERVCKYVYLSVDAVSIKNKYNNNKD